MKRIGWYWSSNNIINNILGSIYGFIRLEWIWQPKKYFTKRVFGWEWRIPIYEQLDDCQDLTDTDLLKSGIIRKQED